MNQKGVINIVLVILVIILAGVAGYFALRKPATEPTNQHAISTNNRAPTPSSQTQTTNNIPPTTSQSNNETPATGKDEENARVAESVDASA